MDIKENLTLLKVPLEMSTGLQRLLWFQAVEMLVQSQAGAGLGVGKAASHSKGPALL